MAACAVRARPGRSGSRRGAGRVGTRSYPATALASPPRRRRRERREEEEEEKGPGPDKTLWFFQGSEREGGQPRRDGAEEGMSGGFIAIERPGGGGSGAGAAAEVVGGVRSGVRVCPAPPAQPCPVCPWVWAEEVPLRRYLEFGALGSGALAAPGAARCPVSFMAFVLCRFKT